MDLTFHALYYFYDAKLGKCGFKKPLSREGNHRMSVRESQGGNEKAEKSREEIKKKRGHMALRNNVFDLKVKLWHEVSPLEYYLVDIIIDKTIKWRAKEARIDPSEWLDRTCQKKQNVYAALARLKKKKIITYRRDKHFSYYGLSEEFFGGVLIKRHEDALKARERLKLAVDNSKSNVEIGHMSHDGESYETLPGVIRDMTGSHMRYDSKPTDSPEIIEEKGCLKTFLKDISLKTSLQRNEIGETGGGREELEGETKRTGTKKRTLEEHRKMVMEQVELARAGKL